MFAWLALLSFKYGSGARRVNCKTTDKQAVREAWEKGPIVCKLVDFGESTADKIQTGTVCSAQTENIREI